MPKKKLEKKPINLTKYCYEKRKNWKQNQRFPCFVVSLFASVGDFVQPVSQKEFDQLIVTLYKIFLCIPIYTQSADPFTSECEFIAVKIQILSGLRCAAIKILPFFLPCPESSL